MITGSGTAPLYLSKLLQVYTPSRTLRSSSDTRLLTVTVSVNRYKRKQYGFRSFARYGPHIWNDLPYSVRHCETISSFKNKLKTHLFSILHLKPDPSHVRMHV